MLSESILFVLLHSIWLGLLTAGLAQLVILFTKNKNASLRYHLLSICLLLFVVATGFIFYTQIQSITHSEDLLVLENGIKEAGTFIGGEKIGTPDSESLVQTTSFLTSFLQWMKSNATLIIAFWFIGVCIKGLFFFVELGDVYHKRRNNLLAVGAYWEGWISQKSTALGIKQNVKIFQSALAKTPMVLGYLKPIILIPIGVLASLTEEQVEAILLHELAHVKRRDYLVNILQSVLEIIFFFNPAVIWVSNLMKIERENCCDDLAIIETKSKTNYIKALVACAEFSDKDASLLMGLIKDEQQLLKRAKRILLERDKVNYSFQNAILSVSIISFFILGSLNVPNKIEKIITGQALLEESISTVQNVINVPAPRKRVPRITAISTDDITAVDSISIEETLEEIINDLLNENIIESKKRLSFRLDQNEFIVKDKYMSPSIHAQFKEKYIHGPDWVIRWMFPLEESELEEDDFYTITGISGKNASIEDRKNTQEDLQRIIRDLFELKLIETIDELSYKLDDSELIVNGIKQNEKIHTNFKKKFLRSDDYVYSYNFRMKI